MSVVTGHQRAPHIFEVRICRPDKRNALNQEVVRALTKAFEDAHTARDVRVVVLASEGSAFSAGADLSSLREMQSASRAENETDSRMLADLFRSIVCCSKPVIARVHGHAIAGGCGLVAACDFAVASIGAKLGFTEVGIGFVPAIVSAVAANRMRGIDVRHLMLTGRSVTAAQAEKMGLLSRAVEPELLDAAVDDLASELLQVSGQAVAATKRLLVELVGLSFEDALQRAVDANVLARESHDCKAGVAAFLDKRTPPWKNDEGLR